MGLCPLPKPWVTLEWRGNPLILCWPQEPNTLLLQPRGPMSTRTSMFKGPQGQRDIHGLPEERWTWAWAGYPSPSWSSLIAPTRCLGLAFYSRQGRLNQTRKETVLNIPTPWSIREVRGLLETAGFCHLWIPGFAGIARPLYEATKGRSGFVWTKAQQEAFKKLKEALWSAPALGPPDVTKPFHLFKEP